MRGGFATHIARNNPRRESAWNNAKMEGCFMEVIAMYRVYAGMGIRRDVGDC